MDNNNEKQYQGLDSAIALFSKSNIKKICLPYLKTGFSSLDEMLGGGICAGLTVLGAVSGLGKSTFSLQMAEKISKEGMPVIYFSLEMPRERIAAKAISRRIFIESGYDKNCKITASTLTNYDNIGKIDWKIVDKVRSKVKKDNSNLYIIERGEESISAKKVVEIVKKFIKNENKVPVVIVDYLQILTPESENFRASDKQNVDESIRQMTALANTEKVPILLISSLSRASYEKSVQLQDLKESGSIEYSADVVLALQFCTKGRSDGKINIDKEKSKSPREVEIVVLKQRYGNSGSEATVKFNYYAEHDCFQEKQVEKKKKSSLSDLPERRIS